MKKLRKKYKKHLISSSKKSARRNKRRKTKKYFPDRAQSAQMVYRPPEPVEIKYTVFDVPVKFKLKFEYAETVLSFISDLKTAAHSRKDIELNMEKVDEIGEGAISMLLTVLDEFKTRGLKLVGKKPLNKEAKDILEKSKFFEYVRSNQPSEIIDTKNIIIRAGSRQTDKKVLSEEVKKAMGTVWGYEGRSPLIFSSIFEMMRNSVDHAFRRSIQRKYIWHISLSHDEKNNKVKFSFVDNGKGIISSISRRLGNKFNTLFKDDIETIETAFEGKLESVTGLSWRGKGLPFIIENYKEGYFKKLIIITNNIYIDFDSGIKQKLKNKFKGTYYYWEVDRTCVKSCF